MHSEWTDVRDWLVLYTRHCMKAQNISLTALLFEIRVSKTLRDILYMSMGGTLAMAVFSEFSTGGTMVYLYVLSLNDQQQEWWWCYCQIDRWRKSVSFGFLTCFLLFRGGFRKCRSPRPKSSVVYLSVVHYWTTNGILTTTICLVAFLILLVRVVWSSIPGLENRKGSIFFHSHFRSFTSFS